MPASSSSGEAAAPQRRGRDSSSSGSTPPPRKKEQQPHVRQESSSSEGTPPPRKKAPAAEEADSDSEEEDRGAARGGRRAPRRSEDSAAGGGSSESGSHGGRGGARRASEDSAAGGGSSDSGSHKGRGRAKRASEDSAAGGGSSDNSSHRGRGRAPRASEDSAAGGDYSDSGEERDEGRRRSRAPRGSEDSAAGGEHSESGEEGQGSVVQGGGARRDSEELELRRRETAAVKIQSLGRGHQARRRAASLRQSREAKDPAFLDVAKHALTAGVRGPLGLVSMKELRAAFLMLDAQRAGTLNRGQARSWLRCAGWALADPELDAMLDASTRRAAWSLPSLLQVLELSQDEENLSVEALQEAFRTLAQGEPGIDRRRLGALLAKEGPGFGEADLDEVLELVGLGGDMVLDCEDVSSRILDAVRLPPSALEQHELGQKRILPRCR